MARREALDPARWQQLSRPDGWGILKRLIRAEILTMEKVGQKRPNCTVKTRKSGAITQENSLIESHIDANFLDHLDKVRGSARRLPIDPTPCLNVQASRCDYRAKEILDRMPPFGLVRWPSKPSRTRRSSEAQQMTEELTISEFTSMETQLDVTNAKTIY